VPAAGGFAARLGDYLTKVNTELDKFSGRVWWTGTTRCPQLKNCPLGRNSLAKTPHDVAGRLSLPKPEAYTFHSFRRSSATSAANGGMTSEQMVDFYGWKNSSMCKEYISTSGPAIKKMADTLGSINVEKQVVKEDNEPEKKVMLSNFNMEDPLVEVEDEPEMDVTEKNPLPEAAGASLVTESIHKTIETAITSVPCGERSVTVKVCVISNNTGTVSF